MRDEERGEKRKKEKKGEWALGTGMGDKDRTFLLLVPTNEAL